MPNEKYDYDSDWLADYIERCSKSVNHAKASAEPSTCTTLILQIGQY